MKMTDADYEKLKGAISVIDTPERRQMYKDGNYPRAEFTKDLYKRYRWDLLFAAGGRFHEGNFMSELYKYLTDSHIDTALKKIVQPI